LPELKIVNIPPELKIVADYGLVVLENAPPAAVEFARFILRDEGQSILTSYGFGRGDQPDD
jgi:ABC-type molybdate transport system substrate-binding protein